MSYAKLSLWFILCSFRISLAESLSKKASSLCQVSIIIFYFTVCLSIYLIYIPKQNKDDMIMFTFFCFIDSREICRYIGGKFADQGNKNLLGTGGLERASIEQWLQSEAKSFDPVASQLVFNLAFAVHMGLKPDIDLVDHCEKKLNQILDVYDERLGESCYLAGDEFTLADLSHLPNSHYLVTTEKGNELFYQRKNVQRWWHDISGRDTWKAVVRMQTEHPGPLEKFATIGNDHDNHDHHKHDYHDHE